MTAGAVLGLRDGESAIADELLGHGDEKAAGGVEGVVEASGREGGESGLEWVK